jgi:hypothetical protein
MLLLIDRVEVVTERAKSCHPMIPMMILTEYNGSFAPRRIVKRKV